MMYHVKMLTLEADSTLVSVLNRKSKINSSFHPILFLLAKIAPVTMHDDDFSNLSELEKTGHI